MCKVFCIKFSVNNKCGNELDCSALQILLQFLWEEASLIKLKLSTKRQIKLSVHLVMLKVGIGEAHSGVHLGWGGGGGGSS